MFNRFERFYQPVERTECYNDCSIWCIFHKNKGRKLEKWIIVKQGIKLWELNANLFEVMEEDITRNDLCFDIFFDKKGKIRSVALWHN